MAPASLIRPTPVEGPRRAARARGIREAPTPRENWRLRAGPTHARLLPTDRSVIRAGPAGGPHVSDDHRARGGLRRHRAPGRPDRAARLDARRLPEDPGPADRPARALRDHRHAARGWLDHPRSLVAAQ